MSYTGNPPEAWSEFDLGDGTSSAPSDRRYVAATGPFRLASNRPQEITFGIVTSFGADNLDSVRQLKEDDRFVQALVDGGLLDRPVVAPRPVAEPVFDLAASIYPIPGSESVTLSYRVPQEMAVVIQAYDTLGRLHHDLVNRRAPAGAYTQSVTISSWPPGAYLVRIQMGQTVETRRVMVVR